MKERLDILIMQKHDISRAQARRIIDKNLVANTPKKAKPSLMLTEEEFEKVEVTMLEVEESDIVAEEIPLTIVYEDKDLLVVHKPVGMVVHPACNNYNGTLVNALMHHCKNLSDIGGVDRPGIVHRLDKGTEGLLVVALNDKTHQSLSRQFANHTITRHYLALAAGNVPQEHGTITGNLDRSSRDRKRVVVVSEGGKNAVTHYTVLKRFNSATLIDVSLETGRTHQIRVHMAYIGHPLIGDPVYNKDYHGKNSTQLLVAYRLGFVHPIKKEYMEFNIEWPTWAKKYQ